MKINHFLMNGFALVLTQRQKATWKWPIKITLESVKDTDKFRLDGWRTERRGLLVPVLKNNNNDVVSNVAFALHLMGKTQPYYKTSQPRPVTERKGKSKNQH